MIQDPTEELVAIVRRSGDDPSPADGRAAALVRRRFGLSLPPPLAQLPTETEPVPVRVALPADAVAIAMVRWRSWRHAYRGILPDRYLDDLRSNPTVAHWIGAATVAPSTRYHLVVAGRPGTVLGMGEARPTRDADLDPLAVTEVNMLYLDPLVLRRGIGGVVLGDLVERSFGSGATELALWVAEDNAPARRFYETHGWDADGASGRLEPGGGVGMNTVRYRLRSVGW